MPTMRNQLGSGQMCQSHVTMSLVPQRSTPRWKEWIPLMSQQQRLRNLLQVMAYNVPSEQGTKVYYTLHVTSMSAPFYTSEKLHHPNPKWVEVEPCVLANSVNTAATGMVIRLWQCKEGSDQDTILLVWGLYMSGLIYLGPSLSRSGAQFRDCAVVLHMFGGFFTAHQWLLQPIPRAHLRFTEVLIPPTDVRPSYNVQRLLRLRVFQQNIKKQYQKAEEFRKRIIARGFGFTIAPETLYPHETNPAVRKILNRTRPKPQTKSDTLPIHRQLELARCRVALLQNEKERKLSEVQHLEQAVKKATDSKAARSVELQERYNELHSHLEELRDRQRYCSEMREELTRIMKQLTFRRRELMAQLSAIYPIEKSPDGKFTIRGIHLPPSEELSGNDEIQISVALGFVTHVVQMLSIFLQVPLRYPLIHFGSRSKIVDNITEKMPDKEREFPLFSRGKDRLQFNYGVYLLNKNIAQLRWLCRLSTHNLRPTLENLSALLQLNTPSKGLDAHKRSMSGSSLDMPIISANASPVGSLVLSGGHLSSPSSSTSFRGGSLSSSFHKAAKSAGIGSSEPVHLYATKNGTALRASCANKVASDGMGNGVNLSYSLDKGLDEYGEMKKAEESVNGGKSDDYSSLNVPMNNLAHVGSEPILSACSRTSQSDRWRLGAASDDETETVASECQSAAEFSERSEFSIVTKRIVELVDGCLPTEEERSRKSTSSETSLIEMAPFSQLQPKTTICASENSEVTAYDSATAEVQKTYCDPKIVEGRTDANSDDDSAKKDVENDSRDAVDVDNGLANVTSRTEALASHLTSFNLMGSRHSGSS